MRRKTASNQKIEIGFLDGESLANPSQRFLGVVYSSIKPISTACPFGGGGIYFDGGDGRGIGVTMSERPFVCSAFKIIN